MTTAAPWIALACAVLAIALVAWFAWRTWQAWKRVHLTQQAAVALLDVHRDRLDEAIARANEQVGVIADDGEDLAEALSELRADAVHLQWMLRRIPESRDRLRRELLDLVLPTKERERTDA